MRMHQPGYCSVVFGVLGDFGDAGQAVGWRKMKFSTDRNSLAHSDRVLTRSSVCLGSKCSLLTRFFPCPDLSLCLTMTSMMMLTTITMIITTTQQQQQHNNNNNTTTTTTQQQQQHNDNNNTMTTT